MLRRIVFAAGGFLLLALAAVAGFAGWALTTEGGRDFVLAEVEGRLPGGSSIGPADGVLAGPLRLEDVIYVDDDVTVRIGRLDVDWSVRALLAGHGFDIRYLHLDDVAIGLVADGDDPPAPVILPDSLELPLPLQLRDGRIGHLYLEFDDGGAIGPFGAEFAGRAEGTRFSLDRLDLTTPWGAAAGALALDARASWMVDGALDWTVHALDPMAQISGDLVVDGDLERLQVEVRVRSPGRVEVQGTVRPLEAAFGWDLVVESAEVVPARWVEGAPAWPVAGRVRLRGDLDATRLDGTLRVAETPVDVLSGDFDLRVTPAGMSIDTLGLTAGAIAGRVGLAGDLGWSGDSPEFDLVAEWSDLAWPRDQPDFASPAGRLHVVGTLEGYRFDGSLQAVPPAFGAGRWRFTGRGDADRLTEWTATGDWTGAQWSLAGDVDWSGDPRGRFDLAVSGLDPAAFDAPVGGRIDAQADVRWSLVAGEPRVDLRLSSLGGELAGQPLGGDGRLRIAGDRVDLDDLRLRAGAAALDLAGQVMPAPRLAFALDVPELGNLVADARGALRADGRIAGALAHPAVHGQIEADGLEWGENAVERARLQAELPTDPAAEVHAEGTFDGIQVGGQVIDRVTLGLAGHVVEHRWTVSVEAAGDSLHAVLAGGIDETAWRGHLATLVIQPRANGAWRLVEPAPLELTPEAMELGRACLRRATDEPGHACVAAGREAAAGWWVEAQVEELPVAALIKPVAPEIAATGTLGLDAQATGRPNAPTDARATLTLSPGSLAMIEDGEDLDVLRWQASTLTVELAGNRLRGDLDMPLVPDGAIRGQLAVGLGAAPQRLEGRLEVDSEQLALLARLAPEVGRVEGRLQVDLHMGGTNADPIVDGGLALADGRITIPRLGLEFEQVTLDVEGEGGMISARLGADSGNGRVEASARMRPAERPLLVEGRIEGANVRAVHRPDARVTVSPDLDWRVRGREVSIDGRIAVPRARLRPRDLSGAVQTSTDLEVVGVDADSGRDAPWRVLANVRVDLGDDVRFDGFGLDSHIRGGLDLREVPGQLTTATGELELVDGSYTIYRQELRIARGRLLFDGGPVENPGLDIRAERRPRNVVVGVRIRGMLRDPRVDLFSDPSMPESDVLSYLMFGVPLQESGAEGRSATAAALTGAGGWVADQVGGRVGIDEVAVEEGATEDETALVLGTYLSPRLYVSYGVGLFESFSRVRLRYSLGRRWALEAQSGQTSSSDLLYTIER